MLSEEGEYLDNSLPLLNNALVLLGGKRRVIIPVGVNEDKFLAYAKYNLLKALLAISCTFDDSVN